MRPQDAGSQSLHQQSELNTKPDYITGHSLQAVSLLVQAASSVFAVPLAARIHEGVVWSNRDREASAKTTFVVVDLEGTASMTVAYAISRADLVVIPVQGSQLDAAEAAKAIRLIRQQEKAFVRRIPYAVLFTRTSTAIKPRTFQHIRNEFVSHGVPAFQTTDARA